MSEWIWNRVSPIATIWWFLALFAINAAFMFAFFGPRTASYLPAKTFDGRIKGFWPREADGILKEFKKKEKLDAYLMQEYVDLVYPLVYGLLFAVAIVGLGKALPLPHSFVLLPIGAVIGDYAENLSVIAMIVRYRVTSDVGPALATIASAASRVKWTLTLASLLLIVVLGIWRIVRR
jgi:hypothetical protein